MGMMHMTCAARTAVLADASEFSLFWPATGLGASPFVASLSAPGLIPNFAHRPIQSILRSLPAVTGLFSVLRGVRATVAASPRVPKS
jgi:hypothetical protein